MKLQAKTALITSVSRPEHPRNPTMKAEGSVNGAESLVRTLVASGVDTCFANPGTSEMHFVAALDRMPGIRCVLALFEGVATGAADGSTRPTASGTLLNHHHELANL
jgi:acetolactate synthase-1/2/3 large subunit